MNIVHLCETGMLIAFGVSWPFNITKSWKSRTARGKSIAFEYIVVAGYLIGLLGKYLSWKLTGELAYSTWFYIADIAMVMTDIVLYYRNAALDRQRDRGEAA